MTEEKANRPWRVLRQNVYDNVKVYNRQFSKMGPSVRRSISWAWGRQWGYDLFLFFQVTLIAWVLYSQLARQRYYSWHCINVFFRSLKVDRFLAEWTSQPAVKPIFLALADRASFFFLFNNWRLFLIDRKLGYGAMIFFLS